MHVQVAVAVLLTVNFIANAYEAEMNGKLIDDDGAPTAEAVQAFMYMYLKYFTFLGLYVCMYLKYFRYIHT